MALNRYRKVSVKMWGDSRFKALTPPKPNGQTLWVYLITGPHTTALPGAFVAGESHLAEALGWSLKDFRKAFAQVSLKGSEMAKADWKARLVFLPNAMKHNAPENPNVVIGWRTAFDELPDSTLKQEIYDAIIAYLKHLVEIEGFKDTFLKAFGKAFHQVLPKEFQKTDTGTGAGTDTKQEQRGEERIAFGEFGRSLLSHDEHAKLKAELGSSLESYIDEFDRWVHEAPEAKAKDGVKRKDRNPYLSIGNWYRKAVKEGKTGGSHGKQSNYETRGERIARVNRESAAKVDQILSDTAFNGAGRGPDAGENPDLHSGALGPVRGAN